MIPPVVPFLILSEVNIWKQQNMLKDDDDYSSRQKRRRNSKGPSSLNLFVYDHMTKDEKVQNVVENLVENYKSILKETKDHALTQLKDLSTETKQIYDELVRQKVSLRAMGFDVYFPPELYEDDFAYRFIEDDYHFYAIFPSNDEQYKCKTKETTLPQYVNGLDTTSDLIELENPYEKLLEDFLKDNQDIEENLLSAEEQFNELNKWKFFYGFSKKKREQLKQAKIEYNKRKAIADEFAKLQHNVEFFNNLTAEQKETLRSFFKNLKDIKSSNQKAKQYLSILRLIDRDSSMATPREQLREYHSSVMEEARKMLSEEELAVLKEFEINTMQTMYGYSDEEAKEIRSKLSAPENGFQINGKTLDFNILKEICEKCKEKYQEFEEAKEKQETQEEEKCQE